MTALSASTTSPRGVRSTTAAPGKPPRLSYVIGTLLGLFGILLGQLGLSIALGNGAYEIRDLEWQ